MIPVRWGITEGGVEAGLGGAARGVVGRDGVLRWAGRLVSAVRGHASQRGEADGKPKGADNFDLLKVHN